MASWFRSQVPLGGQPPATGTGSLLQPPQEEPGKESCHHLTPLSWIQNCHLLCAAHTSELLDALSVLVCGEMRSPWLVAPDSHTHPNVGRRNSGFLHSFPRRERGNRAVSLLGCLNLLVPTVRLASGAVPAPGEYPNYQKPSGTKGNYSMLCSILKEAGIFDKPLALQFGHGKEQL